MLSLKREAFVLISQIILSATAQPFNTPGNLAAPSPSDNSTTITANSTEPATNSTSLELSVLEADIIQGIRPLTNHPSTPFTLSVSLAPDAPNPAFADPNYNTTYNGPVRSQEWNYYLKQWDVNWWATNLDWFTATECLCSLPQDNGSSVGLIASWLKFDFFSHHLNEAFRTQPQLCGPAPASEKLEEEHCWTSALGRKALRPRPHPRLEVHMDGQDLVVDYRREGKRSFTFHNHTRRFDRRGVHTWEVNVTEVKRICEPVCRDTFGCVYDDFSVHEPSRVISYYPPKPIWW